MRLALADLRDRGCEISDGKKLVFRNALREYQVARSEAGAQEDSQFPKRSTFQRKLESAGLVSKQREQYYTIYALRPERLQASLGDLLLRAPQETQAEQQRIAKYCEQVVRAFFKKGQLVQLPKQWKKRVIVAQEFLKDFEPDRDYSEQEVSERIAARFSDYCTIRRILVEEGLMTRAAGVYRRAEPKPQKKKESIAMATRSELKRQYKESERQAGVFQIKNTINGRVFLGSSLNLHGPLNKHRFALKLGGHPCAALQKDYNQHGADAFVFEILEVVEKKDDLGFSVEEELKRLETRWLTALAPIGERGYNRDARIRE